MTDQRFCVNLSPRYVRASCLSISVGILSLQGVHASQLAETPAAHAEKRYMAFCDHCMWVPSMDIADSSML